MESKSRYAAPCFYIPKKDRSLQLVQDYRKLNQITIKDKTLLPLIGEVIDKLKEAKYFNKLNLICVVATTRHSRTNDLITSKALQWAIK